MEEAAVQDALEVFAQASLPAMLGAFYDYEGDTVEIEPWAMRGRDLECLYRCLACAFHWRNGS